MNKLHVYTGDGKGKTTAAMGMALRSLGHGNRVLIAQWLKDGTSGELSALRLLPGATLCLGELLLGFVSELPPDKRRQAAQNQEAYVARVREQIAALAPQMVILDELAVALSLEMVSGQAARALLDTALLYGETVVTGRDAPAWLCNKADYVSRVTAEKHPFATEGLSGRIGVEW